MCLSMHHIIHILVNNVLIQLYAEMVPTNPLFELLDLKGKEELS